MEPDPFINSFVMAANQYQLVIAGQFLGLGLIKPIAARTGQNNPAALVRVLTAAWGVSP